MTGFGAGQATVDSEELSVEVRSWNHKFCEVKVRLPRELASLETAAVKAVKDRVARGSVEVFVKRQSSEGGSVAPTVDFALARDYFAALSSLATELRLAGEIRLQDIAAQPGVITVAEREVDLAIASQAMGLALAQALERLGQMRELEGRAIELDLGGRLRAIHELAAEVEALAPKVLSDYQRRLAERVAEMGRGVSIEPQRLAQEVAFFAERSDIAEEIARLFSHLDQFRRLSQSPEPAGRKMEFLVQEMNREVNTAGSKSQNSEISARVVAMKAELERIREQVQNVE
jgi:uncharacterized protein (TIGR00255 family)